MKVVECLDHMTTEKGSKTFTIIAQYLEGPLRSSADSIGYSSHHHKALVSSSLYTKKWARRRPQLPPSRFRPCSTASFGQLILAISRTPLPLVCAGHSLGFHSPVSFPVPGQNPGVDVPPILLQ